MIYDLFIIRESVCEMDERWVAWINRILFRDGISSSVDRTLSSVDWGSPSVDGTPASVDGTCFRGLGL
jgi:hypothetical protein